MKPVTIDAALSDRKLLGAALGELAPWSTWFAVLVAAFGGRLNDEQRRAFAAVAGERKLPCRMVRELFAIAGRRSGKSRIAAAIAAFIATLVDHRSKLSPGEVGHVLVLAASRPQAHTVFRYARAFLESSPLLRQQIEEVTVEEIRLRNNVVIGVHPNSFRTVRGRTLLACVFDETAYWRDETSALPDVETYRAVLPALSTTGGMLVSISSPYRRAGLMFTKHRDHFGKDSDDVLVVQAPTTTFNPTIDASVIGRARESDPVAAASEWDAEFRSDLSAYLDDELVDRAIDEDRPLELPPRAETEYRCFIDASGGRHDHFTLCIGHREGDRYIADVVRGRAPPFDPSDVCNEFAALAKDYRIDQITGDNYSAAWVEAAWSERGVEYKRAEHPKSQLYIEALPLFTRGLVSIPNHERLVRELRLLERRASRVGKDIVDHGRNGSDDHSNALVGMLAELTLADNGYWPLSKWVSGTKDDPAAAFQRARLFEHIHQHGGGT